MPPFVLLILNCEKYKDKREKQKQTWLKSLPMWLPYYHIIGNPSLETNYLLDENEKILYVKIEDDYNSLPKKVLASYQASVELFSDLKYIFKTDDDQYLINIKFFDTLKNILEMNSVCNQKVHYGGNVLNIAIPYISQYYRIHPELPKNLIIQKTAYCNGRFYFLSKEAIQYLVENKKQEIHAEYLEDYAIGYHLSNEYKKNTFKIETQKLFKDFTV